MKKYLLFFLLLLIGSVIYAQDRTITGVVVDENGEPMPGVSVVIKGTTNGTVTDLDGKFTITAPIGSILVFSFVGYQTMEVRITKDTGAIKVIMRSDSQQLDYIFENLYPLTISKFSI